MDEPTPLESQHGLGAIDARESASNLIEGKVTPVPTPLPLNKSPYTDYRPWAPDYGIINSIALEAAAGWRAGLGSEITNAIVYSEAGKGEKILSPEEWTKTRPNSARFGLTYQEATPSQWDIKEKEAELASRDEFLLRNRGKVSTAAGFVGGFVGGFFDPVEMAASMASVGLGKAVITGGRSVRVAMNATRAQMKAGRAMFNAMEAASLHAADRSFVRTVIPTMFQGAVGGAVENGTLRALAMHKAMAEQGKEYNMESWATDLGFGAGFGTGAGALSGGWRALMHRSAIRDAVGARQPTPAHAVLSETAKNEAPGYNDLVATHAALAAEVEKPNADPAFVEKVQGDVTRKLAADILDEHDIEVPEGVDVFETLDNAATSAMDVALKRERLNSPGTLAENSRFGDAVSGLFRGSPERRSLGAIVDSMNALFDHSHIVKGQGILDEAQYNTMYRDSVPASESGHGALESIANTLGIKIRVVDKDKWQHHGATFISRNTDPKKRIAQSRTVFINSALTAPDASSKLIRTIFHEWAHASMLTSPKAYTALVETLSKTVVNFEGGQIPLFALGWEHASRAYAKGGAWNKMSMNQRFAEAISFSLEHGLNSDSSGALTRQMVGDAGGITVKPGADGIVRALPPAPGLFSEPAVFPVFAEMEKSARTALHRPSLTDGSGVEFAKQLRRIITDGAFEGRDNFAKGVDLDIRAEVSRSHAALRALIPGDTSLYPNHNYGSPEIRRLLRTARRIDQYQSEKTLRNSMGGHESGDNHPDAGSAPYDHPKNVITGTVPVVVPAETIQRLGTVDVSGGLRLAANTPVGNWLANVARDLGLPRLDHLTNKMTAAKSAYGELMAEKRAGADVSAPEEYAMKKKTVDRMFGLVRNHQKLWSDTVHIRHADGSIGFVSFQEKTNARGDVSVQMTGDFRPGSQLAISPTAPLGYTIEGPKSEHLLRQGAEPANIFAQHFDRMGEPVPNPVQGGFTRIRRMTEDANVRTVAADNEHVIPSWDKQAQRDFREHDNPYNDIPYDGADEQADMPMIHREYAQRVAHEVWADVKQQFLASEFGKKTYEPVAHLDKDGHILNSFASQWYDKNKDSLDTAHSLEELPGEVRHAVNGYLARPEFIPDPEGPASDLIHMVEVEGGEPKSPLDDVPDIGEANKILFLAAQHAASPDKKLPGLAALSSHETVYQTIAKAYGLFHDAKGKYVGDALPHDKVVAAVHRKLAAYGDSVTPEYVGRIYSALELLRSDIEDAASSSDINASAQMTRNIDKMYRDSLVTLENGHQVSSYITVAPDGTYRFHPDTPDHVRAWAANRNITEGQNARQIFDSRGSTGTNMSDSGIVTSDPLRIDEEGQGLEGVVQNTDLRDLRTKVQDSVSALAANIHNIEAHNAWVAAEIEARAFDNMDYTDHLAQTLELFQQRVEIKEAADAFRTTFDNPGTFDNLVAEGLKIDPSLSPIDAAARAIYKLKYSDKAGFTDKFLSPGGAGAFNWSAAPWSEKAIAAVGMGFDKMADYGRPLANNLMGYTEKVNTTLHKVAVPDNKADAAKANAVAVRHTNEALRPIALDSLKLAGAKAQADFDEAVRVGDKMGEARAKVQLTKLRSEYKRAAAAKDDLNGADILARYAPPGEFSQFKALRNHRSAYLAASGGGFTPHANTLDYIKDVTNDALRTAAFEAHLKGQPMPKSVTPAQILAAMDVREYRALAEDVAHRRGMETAKGWVKKGYDGIMAGLVGRFTKGDKGGRALSLDSSIKANVADALMPVNEALRAPGAVKRFVDDVDFGRNISIVIEGGELPNGLDAEEVATIQKIAAAVNNSREFVRQRVNETGRFIANRAGFSGFDTRHNGTRVAANRTGWYSFMQSNLDWNKTAAINGGMVGEVRYSTMAEFQTAFLNGLFNHATKQDVDLSGTVRDMSSLDKKQHNLSFAWSQPGMAFDYDMQYGSGKPTVAMVHDAARLAAEDIVWRQFGPNPRAVITGAIDQAALADKSALGGASALHAKNTLAQVLGDTNRIENEGVHRIGTGLRGFMDLAYLPAAGISVIGDFATMASTLRYMGANIGAFDQAVWSGMWDAFRNRQKSGDASSFMLAHEVASHAVSNTMRGLHENGAVLGPLARVRETLLGVNGLGSFTKMQQEVFIKIATHDLAEKVRNHASLSPRELAVLKQAGIEAADFAEIQKAITTVKGLPGERVDFRLIQDTDLRDRVKTYFRDFKNMAVLEADAGTQAGLNLGLRSGTVAREALNLATQYMNIPAATMQKTWLRFRHGYGDEGFLKAVADPSTRAAVHMAGYAASGLVMGYMAYNMSRMARGEQPTHWDSKEEDRNVMLKSLLASGSLGMARSFFTGYIGGPAPHLAWDTAAGGAALAGDFVGSKEGAQERLKAKRKAVGSLAGAVPFIGSVTGPAAAEAMYGPGRSNATTGSRLAGVASGSVMGHPALALLTYAIGDALVAGHEGHAGGH